MHIDHTLYVVPCPGQYCQFCWVVNHITLPTSNYSRMAQRSWWSAPIEPRHRFCFQVPIIYWIIAKDVFTHAWCCIAIHFPGTGFIIVNTTYFLKFNCFAVINSMSILYVCRCIHVFYNVPLTHPSASEWINFHRPVMVLELLSITHLAVVTQPFLAPNVPWSIYPI